MILFGRSYHKSILSHIRLFFKDSSTYPLVSIVVPLYNEEKFIETCLASLVMQSYKNWECIIVNDCSTDGSRKIAETFAARDQRFRIVDHAVNSGLPATRNTGLKNAQGTYITFLDSDDFLLQHSLWRRVLSLHGSSERVAGAFCVMAYCRESGEVPDKFQLTFRRYVHPDVNFLSAKGECPFNVHAVLLRTEIVKNAGGFREELRWGAEDWDLWQRMLRNGYVFLSSGYAGAIYRQKERSMVRTLIHQHCEQGLRLIDQIEKPMAPRDFIPNAPLQYAEPYFFYVNELARTKRLIVYFTSAYLSKNEESLRVISSQFKKGFLPFFKTNLNIWKTVNMAVARQLCISEDMVKGYKPLRDEVLGKIEDLMS